MISCQFISETVYFIQMIGISLKNPTNISQILEYFYRRYIIDLRSSTVDKNLISDKIVMIQFLNFFFIRDFYWRILKRLLLTEKKRKICIYILYIYIIYIRGRNLSLFYLRKF